ncbi:heme exporter protein CcmB [Limnobacter parvus]|uniref:Heme exporter protein CcmB n=1 Tax=Limnobacter parvus TaxID=2939690 RepID=A0ABT1XH20_9BURK|nr:heme exporter protein CcmB [Limnobacter parvus]MCR2746570.1 heme exporter protein CcmB [Limnobacter parvus]
MIQAALLSNQLRLKCTGLQAAGVVLTGEFDCTLSAGVVHVLRGANGVGKSTLLRTVCNAMPAQAVLFKPDYGLRDELLVHEHLTNVLQHLRCEESSLETRLAQVGLSDWQFERIGTLSSGQRARLGLCTLLLAQFKVWLLDEPLNALDADGCSVLANSLCIHLSQGGFVLMASHVDAQQLLQHMPGVSLCNHLIQGGELLSESAVAGTGINTTLESVSKPKIPIAALLRREWVLLLGNPQAVLWGALFHWMVLSFFGIGLGKPGVEFSQVAVWVSLLLAVLLGAKDWFAEDHRVGWMRFVAHLNPENLGMYWLIRVLATAVAQMAVLVPVTGLLALQFGLTVTQGVQLIVAMIAGLWAIVPLLGVVALLVMLTRGGAVLVYLFALPLLVPVLIFGLEASRAVDLGRSAAAPLAVLISMGMLACLLGPAVARRLIQLIQE